MCRAVGRFADDSPIKTIAERLREMRGAMTVEQLAVLLNISRQQVYKLVAHSKLPYIRIGASIRFDPGVIQQWIRADAERWFIPRSSRR